MEKSTIEELLSNEAFISWVKNPTYESNLYWDTWMEDHPEELENLLLAKQIISDIRFKHPEIGDDRNRLGKKNFDRVLSNIFKEQKSKTYYKINSQKTVARNLNIFASIAAAIAIVLVFTFLLKYNINQPEVTNSTIEIITKKTQNGQKLRFMLPDKSFVVLNSASELSYPREFKELYRDIRLSGEAFFDVSKNEDQPFRVHTKALQIEAIGTSFGVKAFDSDLEQKVLLKEGIVRVTSLNDSLVAPEILNPSEVLIYQLSNQALEKSTFDPDLDLAWINGILIFQESDLDDFKNQIERWYGVKVDIKGSRKNEIKISGYFENETLENVLQSLKFSTGIGYEINKDEISLFTKN